MKLFSFKGRASRKDYWVVLIISLIYLRILGAILTGIEPYIISLNDTYAFSHSIWSQMLRFIPLILVLPCLIINIAISVKRLHDLDKCGWFILIPIYNFIVCGFLSGTKGNNKYGNAPYVKSSYYSNETIKANTIIEDKWVCGRCGTLNELYLPKCKKCENEFDNNEIGEE